MVKPQKDVFWKALVFTAIVFLLGVLFGYLLEADRVSKIEDNFEELIIDWDDAESLSSYFQTLETDFCDVAIKQNLKFGDKIYERGLQLERYEDSNRFLDKLDIEKKKYNLLKTKFFINSKIIKEKCNADYDFIFYFYLNDPELEVQEQQKVMSRVLMDVKYELGDKVILMPFVADMDISVVDVLLEKYGVESYPSVVIKENIRLDGLYTVEEVLEFF
jgi:hypothetical protein